MVACQNQKDMWRCGESQYFNGYEAEEPDTDENGDPVYLRDFFPGTILCFCISPFHFFLLQPPNLDINMPKYIYNTPRFAGYFNYGDRYFVYQANVSITGPTVYA